MPGRPNFFIVGAPKCGTTALYEYLRLHPSIFMPRYKEPHFFAKDLGAYPLIKSPDAYAELFSDADGRHLRVGEASVYYLRSSTAIANIHAFDAEAKIIAMFRNPVDMVHALHAQLLYVGEEVVPDFEAAWRLQPRRARGFDLPARGREAFLFQFAELGQVGTQTRRLLSLIPRSQVKLILFDDFVSAPERTYEEVLEFLGLPHDGRVEFPRVNESRRARVAWVKDCLRKPPPVLRNGFRRFKQVMGAERLGRLKAGLVRLNTVRASRPPLSPEFRAELVASFHEEVTLLSRLLGRDLTHWGLLRPA